MRRIKLLFTLYLCAYLTGCAPEPQNPKFYAVTPEIHATDAECAQRAAVTKSTIRALIECKFDKIGHILKEADFQYGDLVDIWKMRNLEVADKLDAGNITSERADLLFTQNANAFITGINWRDDTAAKQHSVDMQKVFIALSAAGDGVKSYDNGRTYNPPPTYVPQAVYVPNNNIRCTSAPSASGLLIQTNCY